MKLISQPASVRQRDLSSRKAGHVDHGRVAHVRMPEDPAEEVLARVDLVPEPDFSPGLTTRGLGCQDGQSKQAFRQKYILLIQKTVQPHCKGIEKLQKSENSF